MSVQILNMDVLDGLKALPDASVHCIVTSPPYHGLRDYGLPPRVWDGVPTCDHQWGAPLPAHHPGQVEQTKWAKATAAGAGQTLPSGQFCGFCGAWSGVLGQEPTLALFITHLVQIFEECKRVLHPTGTFWLNLGDSYQHAGPQPSTGIHRRNGVPLPETYKRQRVSGSKKQLGMVPAKVALALQDAGWILRQDIIWAKGLSFCPSYSGSVMPESIQDRCTWSHEHLFHFALHDKYYYDLEGCREPYAESTQAEAKGKAYTGTARKDYETAGAQNPSAVKRRVLASVAAGVGRNLRNVWVVPKEPLTAYVDTIEWKRVLTLRAPSCDIQRKASPDCPIHGGSGHPVAKVVYDEHAIVPHTHSEHIETGLVPALESDFDKGSVNSDSSGMDSLLNTTDLLAQPYTPSATGHSKQSRRKGLAPLTNPPYTAFAQTESGTPGTPEQPVFAGTEKNTGDYNTLGAVYSGERDTWAEIHDHSDYKSWQDSCICEYYQKTTKRSSHFAAFPTKLVEPAIKLGTSEHGVCPHCAAPWRRNLIKEAVPDHIQAAFNASRATTAADTGRTDGYTHRKPNYRRKVLGEGWLPGCACESNTPVPAVVLDPFCGSGRAGVAAIRLGRSFIGIDASADYCAIAKRVLGLEEPHATTDLHDGPAKIGEVNLDSGATDTV